jgi:hypothetical protein
MTYWEIHISKEFTQELGEELEKNTERTEEQWNENESQKLMTLGKPQKG